MPDENHDDDTGDTGGSDDEQQQDEKLGPEGEKALEAWKVRARDAEKRAKAAETAAEKARIEGLTGQEKAIAEARAEARTEALKEANARLVKAEVKAIAAELKFANPDLAARLLDTSQYDPDNGSEKQIKADLAALLKAEPYLGAGPGTGSGEGGPRGGTPTKDPDGNAWLRQMAAGKA